MIPVSIEYRPVAFIPWKRRIEARIPARWSELSADQLLAIPYMTRNLFSEKKLLHIFLGIRKNIAARIDSYQAYCLLRNLKYITDTEAIDRFLIKEIEGFKAPDPMLSGITFGAFIFGDTYFQNYISGKRNDLSRFIACYYYCEDGFNDRKIEDHARRIRVSDFARREAIAINYAHIREWLAQAYPYVFAKASAGGKSRTQGGWVQVLDKLVGHELHLYEVYEKQPVHNVLRYLNNRIKEYQKNGSRV